MECNQCRSKLRSSSLSWNESSGRKKEGEKAAGRIECLIQKNQPRKVLVRRRPLVRNTFDPNTCWHLWSLLVLYPEKRRMFIIGLHMCRYFNSILCKSSWVAWVISEFGKNVKNSHYKELAGDYCFFLITVKFFCSWGSDIWVVIIGFYSETCLITR